VTPGIRTRALTRTFGETRALDGLTLEVPRGVVFGFLGPNGSGKTTTIRLLLGLLEPTSGTAEVLGHDTGRGAPAIRERCGALLEHAGLYERLTAAENLELFGRFWRLAPGARRARIEELLCGLGLWERRNDVVDGWSRGMKQKLAIARALLHRPELVFLDEPTAGLDPLAAAALRDQIAALAAREGVTVFLTTHNLAEAERLCAQVGVVRGGRLLAVGPPAQLGASGGTTRVEITGAGLTDAMVAAVRALPGVATARSEGRCLTADLRSGGDVPGLVAAVVALLVGGGLRIESVRNSTGSLERAFHALLEQDA